MKTIEIPDSICEACGKNMDRATDPSGNNTPRPGDLTICIECGNVMEFQADLSLKGIPLARMKVIKETMPKLYEQIEKMRNDLIYIK